MCTLYNFFVIAGALIAQRMNIQSIWIERVCFQWEYLGIKLYSVFRALAFLCIYLYLLIVYAQQRIMKHNLGRLQ